MKYTQQQKTLLHSGLTMVEFRIKSDIEIEVGVGEPVEHLTGLLAVIDELRLLID
jgi:hypothetical protein